jgi:hypothetical protein
MFGTDEKRNDREVSFNDRWGCLIILVYNADLFQNRLAQNPAAAPAHVEA